MQDACRGVLTGAGTGRSGTLCISAFHLSPRVLSGTMVSFALSAIRRGSSACRPATCGHTHTHTHTQHNQGAHARERERERKSERERERERERGGTWGIGLVAQSLRAFGPTPREGHCQVSSACALYRGSVTRAGTHARAHMHTHTHARTRAQPETSTPLVAAKL